MYLFAYVYISAMLTTLAFALVVGGRPEQAAAGLNVVASVASWIVVPDIHMAFNNPVLKFGIIDLVAACGFFIIAARSGDFWPVWAFAFSAAAVAATVARIVSNDAPAFLYFAGESAWPYATMLSIVVGTMAKRRRWLMLPI